MNNEIINQIDPISNLFKMFKVHVLISCRIPSQKDMRVQPEDCISPTPLFMCAASLLSLWPFQLSMSPFSISVKEPLPCPACLARMTNLLLYCFAWGMQPGSAKLEWRRRLHGVSLHSSLVAPDCMLRPSQWSSKLVTLAVQAGQGNASLTEILVRRFVTL